MKKTLRASTIIPQELYVHREADRQIQRVLEEMGRPGYVLVARQMGKTNLLLNARREWQKDGDIFVYADLSNSPPTARDCFQSIIDAALDSHSSLLESAHNGISSIRQKGLPAQKEHELELRELLRATPGKLVVILDEIDALTTSTFSDQIFSQIRSIYFLRANLPEYYRLTYILSGVAEPSELIKNPKLSPFNIGEKIYLDDFTRDEFGEFLQKSNHPADTATASRIFEWANGNPRITWDVCSELEDIYISGQNITPETVDAVINKLYLKSFDRAPVDHVRTLAETMPELRSALVEIRYGKGSTLSDNIKSKLYLSGIISSNVDRPKIKNKIIDLALSDQWLTDVERRKLGLLKLASERLSQRQYIPATELYLEFLEKGAPSAAESLEAYDGLSTAFYALQDYRKALEWQRRGRFDKQNLPALYFSQKYREGLCHFFLKEYSDSIACFSEVTGWGQLNVVHFNSLANIASAYFKIDPKEHQDKIISLYKETLTGLEKLTGADDDGRKMLRTVALYNLSQVHQTAGNVQEAAAALRQALQSALPSEYPSIAYELSKLTPDIETKKQLVRSSVATIIENGLRPSESLALDRLPLTDTTFADLLVTAFEIDESGSFGDLFEYYLRNDSSGNTSFLPLYDTLIVLFASRDPVITRRLIARMIQAFSDMGDDRNVLVWTKLLASSSRGSRDFKANANKYIELLRKQPTSTSFDRTDYVIIANLISSSINDSSFKQARGLLDFVDTRRDLATPESHLLFDHYSAKVAFELGELARARDFALKTIRLSSSITKAPLVRKADLETIRSSAVAILGAIDHALDSINRQPRHHRNEKVTVRYSDGRVVTGKFKKLETDIKNGACQIIPG